MVYNRRSAETDNMPQMVPSAGFTPPFDYAADYFDLSLLPGGDSELPLSPSTLLYTQSPPPSADKPKIYTTYYPNSPEEGFQVSGDIELGPDFQKLLVPDKERSARSPIHLEVPNNNFYPSSPSGSYSSSPDLYQTSLISPNYPASPCESFTLYPNSPINKTEDKLSFYQQESKYFPNAEVFLNGDYNFNQFIKKEEVDNNFPIYAPFQIKEENFLSPCSQGSPNSCTNYSNHSSPVDPKVYLPKDNIPLLEETFLEPNFLDKQIKQESTVDFGELLTNLSSLKEILGDDFKKPEEPQEEDKPKNQDHKLLRQVLKDTSFQKKYNLKPIDFGLGTGFVGNTIKMEEPDIQDVEEMTNEELTREKIEPVLSLAIEQMRKDVDNTCTVLGISQDPSQWSNENVKAWIQWTCQQFCLPAVQTDLFNVTGQELAALTEEDFSQRALQSGSILHAQLEIWKAAFMDEDMNMQWTASCSSNQSSNASSGDISDDDDEEASPAQTKSPAPRTGGSHIHLWQFLKELLSSPQAHGSCIRWLDRGKGVFKIEDSVRVAKLWGKRKNRPAMNYDKLSRSIRQYYKKGIMKKTERSQRLVYQFCHPYSL